MVSTTRGGMRAAPKGNLEGWKSGKSAAHGSGKCAPAPIGRWGSRDRRGQGECRSNDETPADATRPDDADNRSSRSS